MNKPPYVTDDNKFKSPCPCDSCMEDDGKEMVKKSSLCLVRYIEDEETPDSGRAIGGEHILIESEFIVIDDWFFEIEEIRPDGRVILKPIDESFIDGQTVHGYQNVKAALGVNYKYIFKLTREETLRQAIEKFQLNKEAERNRILKNSIAIQDEMDRRVKDIANR